MSNYFIHEEAIDDCIWICRRDTKSKYKVPLIEFSPGGALHRVTTAWDTPAGLKELFQWALKKSQEIEFEEIHETHLLIH
jgi:hypothetical protein